MSRESKIALARRAFHARLCEQVLWFDANQVATNADKDNSSSVKISEQIARRLGARRRRERLAGQTSGDRFEQACAQFIKVTFLGLKHVRPGSWQTTRAKGGEQGEALEIWNFEQYAHLSDLKRLADEFRELKTVLGGDYLITPDVVIYRQPETDESLNSEGIMVDPGCAQLSPLRQRPGGLRLLHASISCKWTIRSDRTQNSRSEALNLIRNRKGHAPHIVVVTAEPLPSRLASIALGTGDIDCVYHFALPELTESVRQLQLADSSELLQTLVQGKRLRDISDLPLDLAI